MTDLMAVLASTETLTRNQIADLVADILPPGTSLLAKAGIAAGINALPESELPTISQIFREGMKVAQEEGQEAFFDFLRGLDVPEEIIEVVAQYAPD